MENWKLENRIETLSTMLIELSNCDYKHEISDQRGKIIQYVRKIIKEIENEK